MVDVIKCPVCSESNPADQEFCQYCQSRMHPLTGPLKGADAPLRPGQIPTKKVTAELEPILPQWLREARDKARHSAEEDVSQAMQQPEKPPPMSASEPDLLAGLRSQSRSEDEEETPDWLANITGVAPKSKKSGLESSEARRVELGGKDDFAQELEAPQESPPPWLAAMQSSPAPAGEKDELTEWFRESSGFDQKKDSAPPVDSVGKPAQPQPGGAEIFSRDQIIEPQPSLDAPDWLNQRAAEADASGAFGGDIPSWLGSGAKSDRASPGATAHPFAGGNAAEVGSVSSSDADVPGWLHGYQSKPDAEIPSEDEWLKDHQTKAPDPPLKKHTTPLWLKGTEAEGAAAEDIDTPAWLMDTPAAAVAPPPAESQPVLPEDESFGDIPSWLKAAAPQSSVFAEPPATQAPVIPPEASDWLSSFKSVETKIPEPPASKPLSTDLPDEGAGSPAFTPDAFQDGSADLLFTEMPDWLSSAAASSPAPVASQSPFISQESTPLTPGELPSWVQAMRPVDPAISRPAPLTSDQTLETRGALSGLQGVLPAMPGFEPSSKPKAYSIKLQTTQEQQAHAALLEQILAAEAEPVPITSFSPLRTSRGLSWFISFAVIVLIFGVSSLNTRVFSTPVKVPPEFSGALAVAQNVPDAAPILVAFDYHPARAGEMEAAAAPMLDQMDILRHSRWVLISTNETGPILAERFISGHLDESGPFIKPDYQYGTNYINLGYLPGGVMGIRAFTQNPRQTMQFDISLSSAWSFAPLQGVASLSQFAALIVITDNFDSARGWVEQSASTRGGIPLVVIASSQVAPLVLPYYNSGQVSGIVSGLYGGAIFEQNNAGRPGSARRYWDAYNLGMLLAMSLMLGGGFWSMALNVRERTAAREGR